MASGLRRGKRLARLLDAGRVLVDDHLRPGECSQELRLHIVGNAVRLGKRHVAVHLDMHLNEGGRTRGARAQIVHRGNAGMGERDGANARALGIGQLDRKSVV